MCYITDEPIMYSFQILPFPAFEKLSPRYTSWLWPSVGRVTLLLSHQINDDRAGGQKLSRVPKV